MRPDTNSRPLTGRALICLLSALLAMAMASSPASAAAKKRTMSLSVSSVSVVAGTKITLSGKVTKSPRGTKVRIERLSGRKWKTLKTLKTASSKGTFKIALTPTSTSTYRAIAPKTKKLKSAVSSTRKVAVRSVAPIARPTPPTPTPPVPTPRAAQTVKVPGTTDAAYPSISANGRFVAYSAFSTNDPNFEEDENGVHNTAYVWDRETNTTVRASKAADGGYPNDHAYRPTVSGDGRFVSYYSIASNIVAGDTNNAGDVFMWDRQTDSTVKVSNSVGGGDSNGPDVIDSSKPKISTDGRYITYYSSASNLVADDSNDDDDVFVWERQTGTTIKVSNAADGGDTDGFSVDPSISGDGRYIAFSSDASNIVAGDTGMRDEYVWDRQTGVTTLVSHAADGGSTGSFSFHSRISDDGRYVTYSSVASNIVAGDTNNDYDIFVWDRQADTTLKVTEFAYGEHEGKSYDPEISADGRYITYSSGAASIVAGDTNNSGDVFMWDRQSGTTAKVSQATDGGGVDRHASGASISADGRYVIYESEASNIVADDDDSDSDIFLWDRLGAN